MTVRGLTHHLVAYFDLEAIVTDDLDRPSYDPRLASFQPRSELLCQNSFTTPVDEDDRSKILRVLGA